MRSLGLRTSQPQLRHRWIIGASDWARSIGNRRCKNLSGTIQNFIYCRSNRYRKLWIIFQTPIPKFIWGGSSPPGRKTKSLFYSIFHNNSINILYYLCIILLWKKLFSFWETGYWTRAIKRFALFDLLKSLYSDTKILSKYIPSLQKKL